MAFNRRWFKIGTGAAASVTTFVALFFFLQMQYGFLITNLSGDVICDGSMQDPCITDLKIQNPTKYNIDIYSKDQIKLDFSPQIKDYAFFTKDGRCSANGACRCELEDGSLIGYKGWRCVDFTNKTKARQDTSYVYRFAPYSYTDFRLVGFKNDPGQSVIVDLGLNQSGETIKWLSKKTTSTIKIFLDEGAYGEILIEENGSLVQDYKLIENDASIVNVGAIGVSNIYRKEKLFSDINFLGGEIKDYDIYLKEQINQTKQVPLFEEVCEDTILENGTNTGCYYEISSYKDEIEQVTVWRRYNFEELDPGTYEWRIIASRKINSDVDWVASSGAGNIPLDEWAWWDEDWNYCQNMNITGGDESITNIPFYVNVTYDSNMQSDFDDIRFVNAPCGDDGAELSYEIDHKSDSSSAGVWIKGNLSTGVNEFSMYYGNGGVSSGEDSATVWEDYIAVYHFSETSGTTAKDSSATSNNLSVTGVPIWNSTGIAFGRGVSWNGTSPYYLQSIYALTEVSGSNDRSVLFWDLKDGNDGSQRTAIQLGKSSSNNDWNMVYNPTNYTLQANGGGNDFKTSYGNNNLTQFEAVILDSNVVTWLRNGTNDGGNSFAHVYNTLNANMTVGTNCITTTCYSFYWKGSLDEIRVSDTAFSSAYVNRTRDNTDSNTFSFGDEESVGLPDLDVSVSLLSPSSGASLEDSDVFFNSSVTPTSGNLTNATLYIYDGDSIDTTETVGLEGNVTTNATWEVNLADGSWKYNVLGCANNDTDYICDFSGSNYSFSLDTEVAWSSELNDELKIYLKFDESSGTVALNSVNSTLNGSFTDVMWRDDGIISNAANFTPADFGNLSGYHFASGTAAKSISIWANPSSTAGGQFIANGGATSSGGAFGLAYGWSGSDQKFWIYGQGADVIANVTSSINNWHHVVGVDNGTGYRKLYVDGVIVGEMAFAYNTATTNDVEIGKSFFGSNYWNGGMDELAIWERALTEEEIALLYNSGSGITYSEGGGGETPDPLAVNVSLVSPANDSSSVNSQVSFSGDIQPTSGNVTNATLYLWDSGGDLNYTETNELTGNTTNSTSFAVDLDDQSSWVFNILGCAENSTDYACSFAQSNNTFNINLTGTWQYWLNDNLTVYLKLDEGTGLSSLNYVNATINATYSSIDWTTSGLIENGTLHNTTTNGSLSGYKFPSGSAPKAISAWVYPTASTNGQYLFSGGASSTNQSFGIGYNYVGSDAKFFIYGQGADVLSNATSSTNQWHHVVAIDYGTGYRRIYVDGVWTGNRSANFQTSTANAVTIGKPFFGSGYFVGRMDEVAMWERALNDTEISYLYNGGSGITYSNESQAPEEPEVGEGELNMSVTLTYPSNGITIFNTSSNFSADFLTNATLVNGTLFIWNATPEVIYQENASLTGSSDSLLFNNTFTEGTYEYNFLGCAENSTNYLCDFAETNYSFIIDPSPPPTTCYNMSVQGGNGALSDFPFYVSLTSNFSATIDTGTWGNIRFYNDSCGFGEVLPYEIGYSNSTYGEFWIKDDLVDGWNVKSMKIFNEGLSANETPSVVWEDYEYVYHFVEGEGNTTEDSTGQSDLYAVKSDTVTVTQQAINWTPSPYGFGLAAEFDPVQVSGGESGCLVSFQNTTAGLTGTADRSIFAWGTIRGEATDLHGEIVAIGYPSAGTYYNMRYSDNPIAAATWRLDFNSIQWNTGVSVDTNDNFHYTELESNIVRWFVNTESLGSAGFPGSTASAQVQVGGAFGINAPWNGCVAQWNGTIDEVRIASQTFDTNYVNRTYQNANFSNIVFGSPIGESAEATRQVTLTSPENNSLSSLNEVRFICDLTSDYPALNLTLYLNEEVNYTIFNTTANQDLNLDVNLTLNSGNYNYTCVGYDFFDETDPLTTDTYLFRVSSESTKSTDATVSQNVTNEQDINIELGSQINISSSISGESTYLRVSPSNGVSHWEDSSNYTDQSIVFTDVVDVTGVALLFNGTHDTSNISIGSSVGLDDIANCTVGASTGSDSYQRCSFNYTVSNITTSLWMRVSANNSVEPIYHTNASNGDTYIGDYFVDGESAERDMIFDVYTQSNQTICIDIDHPDYGENYNCDLNNVTAQFNITYFREKEIYSEIDGTPFKSVNVSWQNGGNRTIYLLINKNDVINSTQFNISGYVSNSTFPTDVVIYVNNTIAESFDTVTNSTDFSISTTNNSRSNVNLTFVYGGSNQIFVNVPKDSDIDSATINITGLDKYPTVVDSNQISYLSTLLNSASFTVDNSNTTLYFYVAADATLTNATFTMEGSSSGLTQYIYQGSQDAIFNPTGGYTLYQSFEVAGNIAIGRAIFYHMPDNVQILIGTSQGSSNIYDCGSHTDGEYQTVTCNFDYIAPSTQTLYATYIVSTPSAGNNIKVKSGNPYAGGELTGTGFPSGYDSSFQILNTSYASNLFIDIGADGVKEYQGSGFFNNSVDVTNLTTATANYITEGAGFQLVPVVFGSPTKGTITVDDIVVQYYSYPFNPSLEVGLVDGSREWTYSGNLTGSEVTGDFSSVIDDYLDDCVEDSNNYCKVPFTFSVVNSSGKVKISNINITSSFNPNPIYLPLDAINSYVENNESDWVNVPVIISSSANGTLSISDVQRDYIGGNQSINVTIHSSSGIYYEDINLTVYYSKWDFNFPRFVDFFEFIPRGSNAKNVPPYGQTRTVPIFNITTLNYGGLADYSIYLNQTISCVNIYASSNSTKPSSSLWDGLIGYWPFDIDERDIQDSYVIDTLNTEHNRFGIVGGSYEFLGSDEVLHYLNSSEVDYLPMTQNASNLNITYSLWYNRNTVVSGILSRLVELTTQKAGDGYGMVLRSSSGGPVSAAVYNGSYNPTVSSPALEDNQWYHIVATAYSLNESDVRVDLYINGVLNNTDDFSIQGTFSDFSEGGEVDIGGLDSIPRAVNGTIDEVRIYNRSLNSSEVLELYTRGSSGYFDSKLGQEWQTIAWNTTYLDNQKIWLFADYSCSSSNWYLYTPDIYIRGCNADTDACAEDLYA